MLDPSAAELLPWLAGSIRKQGEYVSRLIHAAAASESALIVLESQDLAGLRELVRGLAVDVAHLKTQWRQVQEELRAIRRTTGENPRKRSGPALALTSYAPIYSSDGRKRLDFTPGAPAPVSDFSATDTARCGRTNCG